MVVVVHMVMVEFTVHLYLSRQTIMEFNLCKC